MYWNPNKLLSYNCVMNICESGRGFGKTFGTITHLCKRFIKTGEQFIYLRRYEKDLCFIRSKFFDAHFDKNILERTKWRVEGNDIIYNEDGIIDDKYDKTKDKTVGILLSFCDYSRLKSVPLPNVRWILFEEYIDEKNKYIKNEVDTLMSIYESTDRSKDKVRMILLGNHASDINPYYEYLGIVPHKESIFTHIKSKSTVIERYKSSAILDMKSSTRFSKLIANTEYAEFMMGNKTLDDYKMIGACSNINKQLICNIIIDNKTYNISYFDGVLYIASGSNPNIRTLSYGQQEDVINIKTIKPVFDYIKLSMLNGKVRYANMTIKQTFNDTFSIN